MAELGRLVGALKVVRRRTLLNDFLRELARWACVALGVLLLAALLIPQGGMALVVQAAVVVAAVCLLGALVRAARSRLSLYQAAAELDRAAALKDRLSTAYFFSRLEEPEGLLRCQRDDALRRLTRVNPQALFPLAVPAGARLSLLLLLAVAGLFAYRIYSGPPLLALLLKAGETRLVKSILSPIAHAMEKASATNHQPAAEPPEGERGGGSETPTREPSDSRGASAGEPSRAGQQEGAASEGAPPQQQVQEAPSGQDGSPGEEGQEGEEGSGQAGEPQSQSDQQRSGGRQQNGSGKDGQSGRPAARDQESQSDSESAGSRNQSLGRTMMQALKNLLASALGAPQAQSRGQMGQNASPGSPQGSPLAGNTGNQSPQTGKGAQRGSEAASNSPSGAQQPNGEKAGTGIGQQPGSEQGKQHEPLGAKLAPDRVALDTQQFSGEAQVRARIGEGTVQSPARNVAGPSTAAVTGAEQENVPLRYRLYVQRYFDQTSKGRK